MTVKELKMMLNDMPDDAILLTRSALDASKFEQATAREMTALAFAAVLCFRVGLMRATSRRTGQQRRQYCSTERR